jgi:hypothetical protein
MRPKIVSALKIALGLGVAHLAACGTTVAVSPGSTPPAAVDRMLLLIDNRGGLRGVVGGEQPLAALTEAVQEGLSAAGYPISSPADLGLDDAEIEALTEGSPPGSTPADHSHLLKVTLEPVQQGKAPTGFSLTMGDSDPRGQRFQSGEVLPVTCALLDGRSLREEAIARSDRAVPKGEAGWFSGAPGPEQRIAALVRAIRETCEPMLGELRLARTEPVPASTTYGSGIRIEVVPAGEVTKPAAGASAPPAPISTQTPVSMPEPLPSGVTAAPRPVSTPVGQGQSAASPAQQGSGNEPAAVEPASVSSEQTTSRSGRKQIRIYNPGGTVILEFGNDRR